MTDPEPLTHTWARHHINTGALNGCRTLAEAFTAGYIAGLADQTGWGRNPPVDWHTAALDVTRQNSPVPRETPQEEQ